MTSQSVIDNADVVTSNIERIIQGLSLALKCYVSINREYTSWIMLTGINAVVILIASTFYPLNKVLYALIMVSLTCSLTVNISNPRLLACLSNAVALKLVQFTYYGLLIHDPALPYRGHLIDVSPIILFIFAFSCQIYVYFTDTENSSIVRKIIGNNNEKLKAYFLVPILRLALSYAMYISVIKFFFQRA